MSDKIFSDDQLSSLFKELIEKIIAEGLNIEELDFENLLGQVFETTLPEAGEKISQELWNSKESLLEEYRKQTMGFEQRLYERWKKPLDYLEVFILHSLEAGAIFNREMRPIAAEKNDFVFEVLTRLHSRSCLVAREVLALLRSGYSSGALSRWRTLHELSVMAYFIKEHGQDVAERYLLHDNIESNKALFQYQEYADTLGYERFTQKEAKQIRTIKNNLCNKYGKCFGNTYGWAAETLNKCNPTFYDIEKAVSLNRLRPYYKLASHFVHANPKGILFNIGLSESSQNVLIAGPSNWGLADPGQCTAVSLLQITTLLLTLEPTMSALIILEAIKKLQKEVIASFLVVHDQLCEEEFNKQDP